MKNCKNCGGQQHYILSEDALRELSKHHPDMQGGGLFSWLKKKGRMLFGSKKATQKTPQKAKTTPKKTYKNYWDYVKAFDIWDVDDGFPQKASDWRNIYKKIINTLNTPLGYQRKWVKEFYRDFQDYGWGNLNDRDAFNLYKSVYKDSPDDFNDWLEQLENSELNM